MEKPIKVRAVFDTPNSFGFYGEKRRYDGDVFTVAQKDHISKVWMEVLGEPKKPGPKSKDSDE